MLNDFVRNCIVRNGFVLNGFVLNGLCNMSLCGKKIMLSVATPYSLLQLHPLCAAVLPIRGVARRRCDAAATRRERLTARGVQQKHVHLSTILEVVFCRRRSCSGQVLCSQCCASAHSPSRRRTFRRRSSNACSACRAASSRACRSSSATTSRSTRASSTNSHSPLLPRTFCSFDIDKHPTLTRTRTRTYSPMQRTPLLHTLRAASCSRSAVFRTIRRFCSLRSLVDTYSRASWFFAAQLFAISIRIEIVASS